MTASSHVDQGQGAQCLHLRPIFRDPARRWVAEHHSHSGIALPAGWLFGTSAWADDEMVGVGMAGRPTGRGMDDGLTVEITRVATEGHPNACSMIYGALRRAAAALGYARVITYTRADEAAACVRAVGFRPDAYLPSRAGWSTPARPRVEVDDMGRPRHDQHQDRVRWIWTP